MTDLCVGDKLAADKVRRAAAARNDAFLHTPTCKALIPELGVGFNTPGIINILFGK